MTILTVFNNERLLNAGLLTSNPTALKSCNLFMIDNSRNLFKSFGEAVLSRLDKVADDEILVICHQDVIFFDEKSFSEIPRYAGYIARDGRFFAGVVGRRKAPNYREGIGFNNIVSGGQVQNYEPISAPEPVDVIDECVMITNKRTILDLNLLCDKNFSWHLYAADACMTARQNGITSYVFPIQVNHLSNGKIDSLYFIAARKLLNKHQTLAFCSTNGLLTRRIIFLRELKLNKANLIQKILTPIKNVLKFQGFRK